MLQTFPRLKLNILSLQDVSSELQKVLNAFSSEIHTHIYFLLYETGYAGSTNLALLVLLTR